MTAQPCSSPKLACSPSRALRAAGIEPVEGFAHGYIEQSALAYFKDYVESIDRGEISHTARGDAEIRQGTFKGA